VKSANPATRARIIVEARELDLEEEEEEERIRMGATAFLDDSDAAFALAAGEDPHCACCAITETFILSCLVYGFGKIIQTGIHSEW
jgi:hypothetical protein